MTDRFKKDCPHYDWIENIKKYDKHFIPPEKPDLGWCGDKGEWIEKCDDPCKRYNELKSENPFKGFLR
ncbi:MAG: hypothetical protein JSV92_03925 [archaeon]|nr:MAG: hypothetical protein JSV92_03925 [archaeon]